MVSLLGLGLGKQHATAIICYEIKSTDNEVDSQGKLKLKQ